MNFTLEQAEKLVETFGGDKETIVCVTCTKEGHSGEGLYAYYEDYPEEGSTFLGDYTHGSLAP